MIKHNRYLIKAIAFDMDGVVIDSNRAIEAFWHQWARHQHIPFTQQTIDTFIHGRTTLETIQELFTQSSPEVKERIRADAMDFDWTMQPSLIPSIHAFLPLLAGRVANIALMTSAPKKRALKMVALHGLESYFQQLVSGEDVSQGKPHPEPYLTGAKKLGVSPQECLVFEDSDNGIASALAAGMLVIAVNNARMTSERIIAHISDYKTLDIKNHQLTVGGDSLPVKLVNQP